MKNFDFYKFFIMPSKKDKYISLALILIFLILGYILVQTTGGTQYAYVHFFYIPIILSGFVFSIQGGVLAGLMAGFLMSPLLPIDSAYSLSQPLLSWTLRMGFFALVGALSGLGSSIFRAYLKELELKQITEPLTGLPNLNGLARVFSDLTANDTKGLVVIMIELSQLPFIEQALGTEGMRKLLKEVSVNLKKAIGAKGTLGLLQGQKFVVLVPDENSITEVLKNCESVSHTPYHIGNIPLFAEMRFGIARYPYDDRDLNNLTRKALIALNLPKNQAAHVSRFDKNTDDALDRNLLILHQLKNAIDKNQLTLEYQPKIFVETGKVLGFEALVRWNDPILGPISPADFVPLAEETLLIHPFTKWLLETSLSQMHAWNEEGLLVPVSINFSMQNFHHLDIFSTLTHLLEFYHIPQHLLEIEVTETSVASSLSTIATALHKLCEVGISIAIDDFGTGQASQQYLLELPIDVIKIDKVFIQSIGHNPAAAAIVKNAIFLAHDLNVKVIAEGVETHKQYDLLKQWGCDGAQGYLVGKSMKGEEATAWLRSRQ